MEKPFLVLASLSNELPGLITLTSAAGSIAVHSPRANSTASVP